MPASFYPFDMHPSRAGFCSVILALLLVSTSARQQEKWPLVARFRGHTSWVMGVAFAPDGVSIFSCGLDGKLVFWNVASTRPDAVLEAEHPMAVRMDGRIIAFQDVKGVT